MAVYYVVFNQTGKNPSPPVAPSGTWEGVTLLDHSYRAAYIKLEAGSIKEAQQAITHFYPGRETTTPVVVTEAQWKES
jgi:hypothetical protein